MQFLQLDKDLLVPMLELQKIRGQIMVFGRLRKEFSCRWLVVLRGVC
jgi:hypothetical protein